MPQMHECVGDLSFSGARANDLGPRFASLQLPMDFCRDNFEALKMISYDEIGDTNIVQITLQGPVSSVAYQDLRIRFEALVERHGSVRVLEKTDRTFLSLASTCWRDIDFCRRYLPLISHVAIVGDPTWVRVWVKVVAPYVTTQVRFFSNAQTALAREWLMRPDLKLSCPPISEKYSAKDSGKAENTRL